MLGNEFLLEEMREAGVTVDQADPEIVVVGYDTTLDYKKIDRRVRSRARRASLHRHPPGLQLPHGDGLRYIYYIGAIMAFIEASTGRRADLVVGKPHTGIVQAALRRTGLQVSRLAMVGDRLYTDIETGLKSGMLSILVMSGETTPEMLAAYPNKPDLVFDRLAEMIPLL